MRVKSHKENAWQRNVDSDNGSATSQDTSHSDAASPRKSEGMTAGRGIRIRQAFQPDASAVAALCSEVLHLTVPSKLQPVSPLNVLVKSR